ncbi:hypothetical protein PMIN01_11575 [Paraphaeosphaeria minitans]|uniref:Uncharacterized protein n=1 Tax=Paraphaeosphaeria minitans TaxID=565426 RepID=A0A9P6KLJ1_9PLEO|nr:hypothetical protein PMIN01_11575 [Paraphaeosphaeria minitans]
MSEAEEEDGWLAGAGLRERSWLLDGVAMVASLGDQAIPDATLFSYRRRCGYRVGVRTLHMKLQWRRGGRVEGVSRAVAGTRWWYWSIKDAGLESQAQAEGVMGAEDGERGWQAAVMEQLAEALQAARRWEEWRWEDEILQAQRQGKDRRGVQRK